MARTKQTVWPMTEEEKKAARLRSEEIKRSKQSSGEKEVLAASKRLILALGAKYSEWRGDEEFRLLNQPVPTQQDATSCGWHVIANAWKYILCKYKNYDINVSFLPEMFVVNYIEIYNVL